MTLRGRILCYYSVTVSLSWVIVGFLCWFEFREQLVRMTDEGVGAALKHSAFEETMEVIMYGGMPALLIGIVGGAFLMRRALRPIEKLTRALEATEIGNLGEPVARSGNGDELDRMTAVFNHMKERLGIAFTQTREFTLHASHELKTPLTVMHSTLEHMLVDPAVAAAHRERVASLLEEVQRLSSIVGQLTFLAKADAGLLAMVPEQVPLDELVREIAEDTTMLASSSQIHVSVDVCDQVQVPGDRMRLRQLLLNLADNAVKYNHQGGDIIFSLRAQGEFACLQITNTGSELAPEVRARVFERFFRGDGAHGTDVEGSGLGLSIAESIVQAHGGTIAMDPTPEGLTCVTVSLPRGSGGR